MANGVSQKEGRGAQVTKESGRSGETTLRLPAQSVASDDITFKISGGLGDAPDDVTHLRSFTGAHTARDLPMLPGRMFDERAAPGSESFFQSVPAHRFAAVPDSLFLLDSALESIGASKAGVFALFPEGEKRSMGVWARSSEDDSMHRIDAGGGKIIYSVADSQVLKDFTSWMSEGKFSFDDMSVVYNGKNVRLYPSTSLGGEMLQLRLGTEPLASASEPTWFHKYRTVLGSEDRAQVVFDTFEHPLSGSLLSDFKFRNDDLLGRVFIQTTPGQSNIVGINASTSGADGPKRSLAMHYGQYLAPELPAGSRQYTEQASLLFSAQRPLGEGGALRLDVGGTYIDPKTEAQSWNLGFLLRGDY